MLNQKRLSWIVTVIPIFLILSALYQPAVAVQEPVQLSSVPSDFTFTQPIRTSTGRIYFLHSNAEGNYTGG